jgi:hypothetical protein
VTATSYVQKTDSETGLESPKIYLTKNLNADQVINLANKMQSWLRKVSSNEATEIVREKIWKEFVDYNYGNIKDYVQKFQDTALSELCTAAPTSTSGLLLQDFRNCVNDYKMVLERRGNSRKDLEETGLKILELAWHIRKKVRGSQNPRVKRPGQLTYIYFLGLFKAAFQTLESYVQSHSNFRYLEIVCVKDSTIQRRGFTLSWADLQLTMDELCTNKFQAPDSELQWVGKCHAEIQMLKHLENIPSNETPIPYIGCSKKPCWMCHNLLAEYRLQTCPKLIGKQLSMKDSSFRVFGKWDTRVFRTGVAEREYLNSVELPLEVSSNRKERRKRKR